MDQLKLNNVKKWLWKAPDNIPDADRRIYEARAVVPLVGAGGYLAHLICFFTLNMPLLSYINLGSVFIYLAAGILISESYHTQAVTEYQRSESLLLNILTREIAMLLKKKPGLISERFEEVSVVFIDIVVFTKYCQKHSSDSVVYLLNDIFSEFDKIAGKYGLEKIKTIGDAYMAVV